MTRETIMKSIKQLLELGDKRTQGEWVFNDLNTVQSIDYGKYIKREEHLDLNDQGFDLFLLLNKHKDICNCLANLGNPEGNYTNDAQYIAGATQMEAKLREVVDMLPTIKDLLSMLSGTYYGVNIDEFKEKLKKWEG